MRPSPSERECDRVYLNVNAAESVWTDVNLCPDAVLLVVVLVVDTVLLVVDTVLRVASRTPVLHVAVVGLRSSRGCTRACLVSTPDLDPPKQKKLKSLHFQHRNGGHGSLCEAVLIVSISSRRAKRTSW
jgi:chemotaxis response regulator CheB